MKSLVSLGRHYEQVFDSIKCARADRPLAGVSFGHERRTARRRSESAMRSSASRIAMNAGGGSLDMAGASAARIEHLFGYRLQLSQKKGGPH